MDYQDALARLGVGSAHPGGMESTRMWTQAVPLGRDVSVLDVGCGTGRTAIHLRQQYGCQVTGLDIRTKMIEQAKRRAQLAGVEVEWAVASAEQLPFDDASFDGVVTESVNVFIQPPRALAEYYRVLKPGGWYVDVEMLVLGPVTPQWKQSAKLVYGVQAVPDQRGWKRLYEEAGFIGVSSLCTRPVAPGDMIDIESKYPDEYQLADPKALNDPDVLAVIAANAQWIENNHRFLGYGVFVMRKPGSEA